MNNLRMAEKLKDGRAIDVCKFGTEIDPGIFDMPSDFDCEDVDLCASDGERWIWSVGKRKTDGHIFASVDGRFYMNPDYECIWLR